MNLTSEEIRIILEAISPKGGGYSLDPKIMKLQAKLSLMLEVAERMGR